MGEGVDLALYMSATQVTQMKLFLEPKVLKHIGDI